MKLIDAIFCDDVRYEMNNKLSLMGLYSDRIILRVDNEPEIKWPVPMNLSLLLRFRLEQEKNQPDHFDFEYVLNDKSIAKIHGDFNSKVSSQSLFTLPIRGIVIPLELGDLGFSIKIYGGKKLLLSEEQMAAIKIQKE